MPSMAQVDLLQMMTLDSPRLDMLNFLSALPSQNEFSCLSGPDIHNAVVLDDAMELEVFSRCSSSHSTKGQSSPDLCSRHTVESAANLLGDVEFAASDIHAEVLDSDTAVSEGHFEPQRIPRTASTLPPKRFFRTFWRSITLRLLKTQRRQRF
jgi:hypothetical protein